MRFFSVGFAEYFLKVALTKVPTKKVARIPIHEEPEESAFHQIAEWLECRIARKEMEIKFILFLYILAALALIALVIFGA